ncbi:acyltransferase family protein [Pseudochelatococcus lubricantis]|uniref:acyltransferase family protein n=1 Tax=Pseudochelatococcus lubricantis TaxID=1538102 RepID=UPI0035EA291D
MLLRMSPPGRGPAGTAQKLVLVQMLRAAAALFVVFHHAQFDAAHFAPQGGFTPSRALPWEAGVDIFFVISGFIIVHSSRRLFAAPGARMTFLKRRLIRIVPLYWLASAAFLAVSLSLPAVLNSPRPGLSEVIASFLFWPYVNSAGVAQPMLSLGWTLNYEMAFYLVFALAIALPGRHAVLAVALFLSALVGLGTLVALPMPLAFWADSLVFEFVFGMGIAMLREAGGRPGIVLRVVLFSAAIRMLQADLTQDDIVRAVAWGVPAAMLVMAAVYGPEPRHPPLLGRLIVLLGDASYALYLFHPFALRATRLILSGMDVGPWGYVAIALPMAMMLAVAVHLLIERPVMRGLRRLLSDGNGGEERERRR